MLLSTSSQTILAARVASLQPDMHRLTVPTMAELLDPTPVPPWPYRKTWSQARFDPFVCIQSVNQIKTSQIVTLKHGNLSCIDALQSPAADSLAQRYENKRLLPGFPFYHHAGLLYGLVVPVWLDSTAVLPLSGPLTSDGVDSVHVHGDVEVSFISADLANDMAMTEKYLDNLRRLRILVYEGLPLPDPVGKQISKRTHLAASYGAAEYLTAGMAPTTLNDWPYLRFNENAMGIEFNQASNELFEMVFVRKAELDAVQSIFVTFPEAQEYHTNEFFERVASKPGLWKHVPSVPDVVQDKPLRQSENGTIRQEGGTSLDISTQCGTLDRERPSQASHRLRLGKYQFTSSSGPHESAH